MQCRFIDAITQIDAANWNAITGTDYPFSRHEFLAALEQSGSVGHGVPDTATTAAGWQAHHCIVEQQGQVIAVLPLYIKRHSYGEYVFDFAWAEAYQRHGLHYYPKLLAAIPFTPATGPRLSHNLNDKKTIAQLHQSIEQALSDECRRINAHSWHVLFHDKQEHGLWQAQGEQQRVSPRISCHFQWFNRGFSHFDDFLQSFSSRKRKNLRKERQTVQQQGIRFEHLTGAAITAQHWQWFYHFYQATYAKRSGHGGYLTADFFHGLQDSMAEQILLVMAYQGDKPIAAALNFFSDTTLYGRYWGALVELDCLHFETCYYQGIDFCIAQGLQRFDPGVQGEHKIARGFEPVMTYSSHHLLHEGFNDAVAAFVAQEHDEVMDYQARCKKLLPFKKT